jgi:phage/plasmid-associated DNA primase
MLFAANELPVARDHTLGYESRWVVVPFTRVTLAPGAEDRTLEPRMHGELDGVLVRAVEGLRRALGAGEFTRPPSVVAATDAFRRAGNPLHAFVDECLEVTGMPTDEVSRDGLLTAYRDWCRRVGHRPLGPERFWRELRVEYPLIDNGVTPDNPNGYRRGHGGATRVVLGVRIEGVWP